MQKMDFQHIWRLPLSARDQDTDEIPTVRREGEQSQSSHNKTCEKRASMAQVLTCLSCNK